MPIISVVITTYNSAKYIGQAIQSVIDQTFKEIEVIVVDDGSNDQTLALAQSYADRDRRIRICARTHAGKPSVTRNAGIREASGKYVSFLDGDDCYAPLKLERGVAILEKFPRLPVVFHDMQYTDEAGNAQPVTYLKDLNFLARAKKYLRGEGDSLYFCGANFYTFMSLYFAAMHTSTVLIRRSVMESDKLLFAEDVRIGEDTEFWWSLAKGREVAYIDEVLSYYRIHDASVTRDIERYHRDLIRVHARNYERAAHSLEPVEQRIYRRRIASHCESLGYYYFARFRLDDARKSYQDANRWYRRWHSSAAYLKTFLPVALIVFLKRLQGKFITASES